MMMMIMLMTAENRLSSCMQYELQTSLNPHLFVQSLLQPVSHHEVAQSICKGKKIIYSSSIIRRQIEHRRALGLEGTGLLVISASHQPSAILSNLNPPSTPILSLSIYLSSRSVVPLAPAWTQRKDKGRRHMRRYIQFSVHSWW